MASDPTAPAVGDLIDRTDVERLPDGAVVRREPDEYGGPYAEMLVRGGGVRPLHPAKGDRRTYGLVGTAPNGWRVVRLPSRLHSDT